MPRQRGDVSPAKAPSADSGAFARAIMRIGADASANSSANSPEFAEIAVGAIGSRLAQALLDLPSPAPAALLASIASAPPAIFITLSKHPLGSHVIQSALSAGGPSKSAEERAAVGAMVTALQGHIASLARHRCPNFLRLHSSNFHALYLPTRPQSSTFMK